MAQSVVTDNIEKTQTTSYYGYDAFGRRTLVQDAGFATMRTLYDGQSFDIIRENEVFGGGDFTTSYMQGSGIQYGESEVTNERYRYKGDFTTGLDNGYTGKPYDQTTGLYNYGYRDYSPETARFTTVDPIRDGNNWFSYVVNDPVNYVDLWGLETENCGTDAAATEEYPVEPYVDPDGRGVLFIKGENSEFFDGIDDDLYLVKNNSPTFSNHYDSLAAGTNGIGQELQVEIHIDRDAFEFAGNTRTQSDIVGGVERQSILIEIDLNRIPANTSYLEVVIEEFVHAAHAAEVGPEAWNTQAEYENENFDYADRPREIAAKSEVEKIRNEHNASIGAK